MTHPISIRSVVLTLALATATQSVLAQTPPRPAFDVAAISPGVPLQTQITTRQLRLDRTITESRVSLQSITIADLVILAYRMQPYQVTGPDWIKTEVYDIQATLPSGATKEQVPEMMQTLLEERFKLKFHRDKKEQAVYARLVGKDGHNLQPYTPEPAAPVVDEPGSQTLTLAGQQVRVAANGSATVQTPDGISARIEPLPDGNIRMNLSNLSMAALAQRLTTLVDKPVVDFTGITGTYNVPLELKLEDVLAVAQGAARTLGVSLPGVTAEPGQAPDPSGSSVFASVQKMGLRLDPRKAPVEIIVVDSVEKTATAN